MDTAIAITSNKLPTLFSVALDEQLDFAKIDKFERLRIRDLLEAFKTIANSNTTKQMTLQAIAAVNVGRRGFSVKSLDRSYRNYIQSGYNWRVLVRNYKGSKPGQPEAFKNFFCGLVMQAKGRTDVIRAAKNDLFYNYWQAGKAVPGYGTFAEFWRETQGNKPFPKVLKDKPPHTPRWSYRTLCRVVEKSTNKQIRILGAHGDLIGHNNQMQLFRDRTGLKPLQYVTFDDVELDIQCLCRIGDTYEMRTLQAVMALDIATAKFIGWYVRPMLKAEDELKFPGDVGRVLTRKQVNACLMQVLLNYGLPEQYPMRLLLENASGTLSQVDRQMIETMLPGRIVFENTRMFNESALGIECRAHGLPYQKGFIESSFQGLHTSIALLPGALSPRYEFRHPVHAAIANETKKLLNTAKAKGIKDSLLKFKALTYDEFLPIFNVIVERWNARSEHKLQGFEYEYETIHGSDFINREQAIELLTSEELEVAKFTKRMETPEERWQKLSKNERFTKIEVPTLFPMMADKRIVTVRNGQISMDFKKVSADKFYYRAPELAQYEGREFIAATVDREAIWLFNKNEGYICCVPRLNRVLITDQTAIVRQSGIVHREREVVRKRVEEFQSDITNRFKEIDVHNAAILADNANIGATMMATKTAKVTNENINADQLARKKILAEIVNGDLSEDIF